MLKYMMAAGALKAFSMNDFTKRAYRKFGNSVGQRKRLAVDDLDTRVERGDLLLDLCEKHQAIKDGDRILEIGTGWMHWFSLYVRLFHNVDVTAFDVWDNRQFLALQAAAQKLWVHFKDQGNVSESALNNLQTVIECKDFEEFYRRLNFDYVIERNGSMAAFTDEQFDFITSFHVLEHVPAHTIDQGVKDMYRSLKPGGYMIHQIGIDDHLTHYDGKASPKQYIKYSDKVWRAFFQNDVQYFNRWQASEWIEMFDEVGFELVDKICETASIDGLKIDSRFSDYSAEDLACTILTIVYRKPH